MLTIKDPEADRLARRLAEITGETITGAVRAALRERLERLSGRRNMPGLAAELDEIAARCAALPVLDDRTPEQIIGYDDRGLPS